MPVASVQMRGWGRMMLEESEETMGDEAQRGGSSLIPSVRYRDAGASIAWLERALGFVRHAVYTGEGGVVVHAELRRGNGLLMVGSVGNPSPMEQHYATPADIGNRVTSPLYLVAENCAPVWASAQAAGAEVLMTLQEMPFGGKAFTVRDPEGHVWSVEEYDPWKAREAAVQS